MNVIQVNAKEHSDKSIPLNYQSENEVTVVEFDLSSFVEEYGEGTAVLHCRRAYDSAAYINSNAVQSGNKLVWTVTETDLQYHGYGEVQVVYTVGDKVAKGAILQTYVGRSLDNSGTMPDVWQPVLDEIRQIKEEVSDKAEAVEESKEAIDNMTATASIDSNSGTPYVNVTSSIVEGVKVFNFDFHNLRGSDGALSFVIVEELPTTDIHTNWIYLVADDSAETGNRYKEYVYIENAWEQIGSASIDLSNYIRKLTSFTVGHIVTLSADGSIADSGIALSDLATKTDLAEKANTEDVTEALAEKVGFTDYATTESFGVVKAGGAAKGIGVNNGVLSISGATGQQIEIKASAYAPITPANLDFAVFKALENNSAIVIDAQKDAICQTIGAVRSGGGGGGGLTTRTISAADNPISATALWSESNPELNVQMLFNRALDIDMDNILFIVAKFNHYPYDYTVIGQVSVINITQYQTQIMITIPNFKPKSWTSSSKDISMTIVYDK